MQFTLLELSNLEHFFTCFDVWQLILKTKHFIIGQQLKSVAAFQSRTKMPTGTSTFSETFLSTFADAAGLILPSLEGLL